MIRLFQFLSILTLTIFMAEGLYAQATLSGANPNTITTAVPFLSITPDSRAGGMGDAGVGTTPDVNSMHWNPAKFAFMESDMGVALSYSPWLRNLVSDIDMAYLTGYKKLDDLQTVSASLRYFSLGEITFTDINGSTLNQAIPNEFAIDMAYTRQLSDFFSGAVAVRYIRSDLTNGQMVNGVETRPGNSFASDVAFYYYNEHRSKGRDNIFSAGINIQNIGAKISYTDGEVKDFLPTTLKLGTAYTMELDQYNSFSFTLEANKLLVPTPPKDSVNFDPDAIILPGGSKSNMGVVEGIFTSFYDAPGGIKEELQEIMWSVGVEYWYSKQFAIRTGYFYEHENKGNRSFFTAGAGLRMNVFALDFSYLLPTQRNHPLENTLRFTLSFDIDAFGNQRR